MTLKIQRLLASAKKNIRKGNIEAAKDDYFKVLKSIPNHQEAKKQLSKLSQNNQTSPTQSQLDLIIKLYASSQIQDALSSLELLINDYPHDPSLFNIRGACFKAINQMESAVDSFKNAINIKPDYAEAYFNLGITLQELNKPNEAIKYYEKAISIKPAYPTAHNNLGLIFLGLSQLDSAADHFNWAISYNPEFAEAQNNLGATLQQSREFNESIKHYLKATTINPNYTQAFNNLGIIHQTLGQQVEAIKYFQKAISLAPNHASAYFNLSRIKTFLPDDIQISQMQSLVTKNLNIVEKIYLNFALAKANEDLEKKDDLFKFLNQGNQLCKEKTNYSIESDKLKHTLIQKIFSSPKYLSEIKANEGLNYKLKSKRPIFIIGMPRSGTTLVEQIISSHKKVYGAEEMSTLSHLISEILKKFSSNNSYELNTKSSLSIRHKYLSELSNLNVSENIITDKWPLNFQYVGFILEAFPEAKIIHLKRDSRATCWSIYKHFFSDIGNGWAYNFKDLAGFYNLYSEMMAFWHELFPNKIYDISYEDLTTNQEEETRKLLEYCDLDWDENCLNFHKNERAVKTASALQVREKMYQGSSDVWKEYEAFLQPLIKGLKSF